MALKMGIGDFVGSIGVDVDGGVSIGVDVDVVGTLDDADEHQMHLVKWVYA